MAQVKWRPRAVADIGRLHNFLYKKDIVAARRAAYAIYRAAKLLENTPRIGRPMPDETRRRELFVPFGAGAYVLRYMLEDGHTVVIIRVWHSRENRNTAKD